MPQVLPGRGSARPRSRRVANQQSAHHQSAISNSERCPTRFSRANGARSVLTTSSASVASRRRSATPSARIASPSRSSLPGRAASGRRPPPGSSPAALNCEKGPTANPCGTCDACVEIAEGRDIDVLEIDAATHTQVDKIREIIIAGLGMAPVRNRYKVFIIDEVHRLSPQSFDALLKSIEEPPPHVIFMMATTEIEKVPATIQSRSQVFELKTIGVRAIADQLRRIADAEEITIDDAALMLMARAGDGSMRDAQSAFDQVIAFAGPQITSEDVSTVLGLVRRDLLLDIADAVAREDAAAAFKFAGDAVESGYDLRLVVRELARLTRDLLVVTIDPSRVQDPEIAADGDRERLQAIAARFSARRPDARLRGADEGGIRHPHLRAAALSPRDGAAALDPPAEARAAQRPHSRSRQGRSPCSQTRAVRPAARPAPRPPASNAATVKAVEARKESARAAAATDAPAVRTAVPWVISRTRFWRS